MAFGSWCDSLQTWRKLTGRSKYNCALTDDDFTGLLGPNFKVEWLHWSHFRPAPLDIIICTLHSLDVEWSILSDFGDQFPPFFDSAMILSNMVTVSPKKQGQKLVLSDALAVQSQGPKVLSAKVVFGSQQMFWDLKECFGISKMYWQLESQKKLTLLKLFTQLSLLKLLLILLKQSETIPSSNWRNLKNVN